MALTRGELKGKVLRLLNKTALNPGFYTDDKINEAIQEAMDFVACEMFVADEGWQKKIWSFNTSDGQLTLPLPEDIVMVEDVRYLIGDIYVPMRYYVPHGQAKYADDSSARQDGGAYEVIDNMLYFNPALAEGQTAGIQVVGQAFAQALIDDMDFIEGQFNRAMTHYMKYGAASILAASIEKATRPWAAQEAMWYSKMQEIVEKRNKQSQPIREFEG
jgi:hypothetical protein